MLVPASKDRGRPVRGRRRRHVARRRAGMVTRARGVARRRAAAFRSVVPLEERVLDRRDQLEVVDGVRQHFARGRPRRQAHDGKKVVKVRAPVPALVILYHISYGILVMTY